MAKETEQKKSPGLLSLCFWLITRIIGWLFLGGLGCVAIAIVIVSLHGQVSGLTWLQSLLQDQLHYLSQNAHSDALAHVYRWLQIVPSEWTLPSISLPLVSQHADHNIALRLWPFIQATFIGTKLLIVRLYLLLRWSALFLLFGFVGLIDGLGQRAIRRASVGRESALIYHQAKALIMLSLILGIFVSLLLPIATKQVELLVVVSALLFGLAFQITAKRFKKYI